MILRGSGDVGDEWSNVVVDFVERIGEVFQRPVDAGDVRIVRVDAPVVHF